ncbi:hypothetical protein [Rhizobium sp. IMFF44]|uniref:hypothetical protein n=1 Tax=unclassified Rhizobium TaxID=2613769 RepID=UPI0035BA00E1
MVSHLVVLFGGLYGSPQSRLWNIDGSAEFEIILSAVAIASIVPMSAKHRNAVKELQYVIEVLRSSICDLHFADGWIYDQFRMAFRCDSLLDFNPVYSKPCLIPLCVAYSDLLAKSAYPICRSASPDPFQEHSGPYHLAHSIAGSEQDYQIWFSWKECSDRRTLFRCLS